MSRDDIAAMTAPEQYHAGQVSFAAGEGALDAMTKGSMYLKGWCAGAEALRLATTEHEALLRNRGRIREALIRAGQIIRKLPASKLVPAHERAEALIGVQTAAAFIGEPK
jgi:hypothetical protein